MSVIGCRFAVAVTFAICGHAVAMEPNLVSSTDQQSPRGVAEFAAEFADAEQAEKPLVAWTHPFTQYIASRRTRIQSENSADDLRWMHRTTARRPPVYLEDDVDLKVMQPTVVERLIAQGYGSGDGFSDGEPTPIERRPDITNHLAN